MNENFGTINRTLYLKSHFRRPVRARLPLGMVDVQGAIPPGWCTLCGAEVWEGELCRRCEIVGAIHESPDICG